MPKNGRLISFLIWRTIFYNDSELGVKTPDYITRVTEYIPEIIGFIKRIMANGYAYMANGSVYFDLEAYKGKYKYGKLKRVNDAETEEA